MSKDSTAHTMIREAGGVYERKAKHGALYRLPNGNTILLAGSPGDCRSFNNFKADLKRALQKKSKP